MSTLVADYDTLRRAVGRFLGYDRDPNFWDEVQTQDVGDILASGQAQFYWPPPLVSEEGASPPRHTWSFLKKHATLDLAAGTADYDLPDDFVSMASGFVYTGAKRRVTLVPLEVLLAKRAMASETGAPNYCALRSRAQDQQARPRWEGLFYPTPDTSDTVEYAYVLDPPLLSETNPNPLGGPVHYETLLESCLAVAERMMNDEPGLHTDRFMRCLASSIQADVTV